MARRSKKNDSLIAVAMTSHWGLSASLAAACLFGFLIFIPAVLSGSRVLKPLGPALAPFGYVLALFFAVIAVVNYARQSRPRDGTTSEPTRVEPRLRTSTVEKDKDRWQQVDAGILGSLEINPQPRPLEVPKTWSLDLLKAIEWKRFEEVVAAFYREKGVRCETQQCGADGGIDAKLYIDGASEPNAIVQCKAWTTRPVGVKAVRELFGVMAHEKIAKGFFMATGGFTPDALEFTKQNPITPVSGELFLAMIRRLSPEAQQRLLAVATEGDYTTPTCASCGIKMVLRPGNRGGFWGCTNYPRCRTRLFMSS